MGIGTNMTIRQINVITGVETVLPDNRVISEEAIAEGVRSERNLRLQSEVDVIASNALRWAALSSDKQAEWATYRTALLNVPQQSGFPDVTWPTKPE
tara:strand:- start:230 stop:520 length:291 start_codon:yes stop_codon:yes gene_type:complete